MRYFHRIVFFIILGSWFFTLISCAPTKYDVYRAKYDISLNEVERPAQAKQRYGEQRIEKVEQEGTSKYSFEDQMVRIDWFVGKENVNFILWNKTDHSIKIIWDEAAFVDMEGVSHRVMHSGVKYSEMNNPQPPTVVVRGGKVEDLVCPTDNVYWQGGYYPRWVNKDLFPTICFGCQGAHATSFKTKANACAGKKIQVLLPLRIEDVVNDYIFAFTINDVEVTMKVEERNF